MDQDLVSFIESTVASTSLCNDQVSVIERFLQDKSTIHNDICWCVFADKTIFLLGGLYSALIFFDANYHQISGKFIS